MEILILEDDQRRIDWFKTKFEAHKLSITKNTDEAIKWLKEQKFDYAFLDHDLGDEVYVDSGKGTGYEVAQAINENKLTSIQVIIHTCNPIGAVSMSNVLKYNSVTVIPFPRLMHMSIFELEQEKICEQQKELEAIYKEGNNLSIEIKEITLELTNFCPHECKFCSSNAGPYGKQFMSMDVVRKRLVDKYDIINLSGGEPLAHPKIWSIIEICQKHLTQLGELWLYSNVFDGIRFNGHVRDRVKVHMNIVVDPDIDQVHVLKAIEHGRQVKRPKVSVSGHDCKNCNHAEIRPDGRVEKPCNKT